MGARRERWVEDGPILTLIREARKKAEDRSAARTTLSGFSFLRPTAAPTPATAHPAANAGAERTPSLMCMATPPFRAGLRG